MSNRKTPGTTIWLRFSTRDKVNEKKKPDETADSFIRRLLGGKR